VCQWTGQLGEVPNVIPEEVAQPHEGSDLGQGAGHLEVSKEVEFLFARGDAVGCEGETQVGNLLVAEKALVQIDFESILLQSGQGLVQDLQMTVVCVRVDDDVVDVDEDICDSFQYMLHESLEGGWTSQ